MAHQSLQKDVVDIRMIEMSWTISRFYVERPIVMTSRKDCGYPEDIVRKAKANCVPHFPGQ